MDIEAEREKLMAVIKAAVPEELASLLETIAEHCCDYPKLVETTSETGAGDACSA
jgi:hypothetical protein